MEKEFGSIVNDPTFRGGWLVVELVFRVPLKIWPN